MSVSKKGMEMSINIVVGLILGIAMLSAGLLLFNKILFNADNTEKQIDEQTKERIYQALDTGDPIYVPVSNVEVEKKSAQFWVGIRNIDAEAGDFKIEVSEPSFGSGNPSNFQISRVAVLNGPYTIGAKENQVVFVVVDMKGITERVTLRIDVTIENETGEYPYSKPKLVTIQP
jgi:hypothetical protein